ncbi:MAG: tetratricopeptide repeat protein [Lachnospiraceae bacterium]
MTTLSKNLKRFRVARNLTQEQAAGALGVSTQSVSRWECNTTLPDAAILPEIARLYCVTIDDLYKEASIAYENYAQRLGAIYESTKRPEDFLAADVEYRKLLNSDEASMEDLRLYGILHQYMMNECRDKAFSLFDRVLEKDPAEDEETYYRTKRQKISLICDLNRGEEFCREQEELVKKNPQNVQEWICLLAALEYSGAYDKAEAQMKKALERFPENPTLLIYCGDICRDKKNYEEAFAHWKKAFQLNPSYVDALYSQGFCYEELGDYKKAYEIWTSLSDTLASRGFDLEKTYPQALAEKCREKLADM